MLRYYMQYIATDMQTDIIIPNELAYVIEFVKILSISGSGLNAMTELKCQSLLSIKDIKETMIRAQFCYPLKEAMLDFLL